MVETHASPRRQATGPDGAGVGAEPLRGHLRVDPALDGESTALNLVLGQTDVFERGAAGDVQLRDDEVDSSDFFRDGMLDLSIRGV